MTAWWYAEKDKKTGPLEQGDLARLIQSGKIDPGTMLWKEGMESWLPLDEIKELQTLKAAVPPPLPPKVSADPLTYPMAARWAHDIEVAARANSSSLFLCLIV
jgi:hypothetical protein